jgi:hypothetical protein
MEISPDCSFIMVYLLVFITNTLIFISLSISVAGTFCRTVIRPGCDKQDKKMPTTNLWEPTHVTFVDDNRHISSKSSFTRVGQQRIRSNHHAQIIGFPFMGFTNITPRINRESSFRKKESSLIRMRGSKIPIMRVHVPVKTPPRACIDVIYFFEGACADWEVFHHERASTRSSPLCARADWRIFPLTRVGSACAKWNTARTRTHHGH